MSPPSHSKQNNDGHYRIRGRGVEESYTSAPGDIPDSVRVHCTLLRQGIQDALVKRFTLYKEATDSFNILLIKTRKNEAFIPKFHQRMDLSLKPADALCVT